MLTFSHIIYFYFIKMKVDMPANKETKSNFIEYEEYAYAEI